MPKLNDHLTHPCLKRQYVLRLPKMHVWNVSVTSRLRQNDILEFLMMTSSYVMSW